MTSLQQAQGTEDQAEVVTITTPAGFIQEERAQDTAIKPLPLFVSLDAARASGSPVYSLDEESRRVYLPSSFIASIHLLEVVEREYRGDYEPYRKLVIRLTIGDTLYALFVGANSWASQSLLTSLGQLTAEQLHKPMLFKAVAGRRTCFFRVSTDAGDGDWTSIAVEQNFLSNRMETEELELLAASIDGLLGASN